MCIRDRKRCKKLVDENMAEMTKYEELARKALAAGNEADARVFLAKKQELAGRAEGLTVAYALSLIHIWSGRPYGRSEHIWPFVRDDVLT